MFGSREMDGMGVLTGQEGDREGRPYIFRGSWEMAGMLY